MTQASPLEPSYQLVEEVAPENSDLTSSTHSENLPLWLNRICLGLSFFLLIIFPLMFGGVHVQSYSLARIGVYAGLLLLSICALPRIVRAFEWSSYSGKILAGCGVIFLAAVMQTLLLSWGSLPHPVLGSTSRIINQLGVWSAFAEFFYFVGCFVFFRALISSQEREAKRIAFWLMCSGMVVSLVALSHWFYDNGKLFWTFEPENVFTSSRARWPFVNSNHLGHFLLPLIFLAFSELALWISEIRDTALETSKGYKRSLSILISNRRIQRRTFRIAFGGVFILAALISVAGTLSRGSWIAFTVGLVLFMASLYFRRNFHSSRERTSSHRHEHFAGEDSEHLSQDGHAQSEENSSFMPLSSSRRRKRAKRNAPGSNLTQRDVLEFFQKLSRLGPVILFILTASVTYLFLQGRGTELVKERLDYGLMHSLEDMRWQLYEDTIPMVKDHPLLGVGLGAWAKYHPQYMSEQLTGINPIFTHSEPLQLLAEGGVLLFSLVSALVVTLLYTCARASLRSNTQSLALPLWGCFSGGVTLIVASFFDFPFRIPAIVTLAAAYLAVTAFYLDRSTTGIDKPESKAP